jgi:uncharacterized protein YciI
VQPVGQDWPRGILLLPPRPARFLAAARRTAARALVVHGPVCGRDDRPRSHARRTRRRTHGSVHIVDLPDPAAARAFAFDEPNYQAGVYRDVLLRRWRNTLGRNMWDFPGGHTGGNRYLVLGLGTGPAADLAVPTNRDELIAYGPLVAVRRRRPLAGYGRAAPSAGPRNGARHPCPRPLRRHRGPLLAVRRPAIVIRVHPRRPAVRRCYHSGRSSQVMSTKPGARPCVASHGGSPLQPRSVWTGQPVYSQGALCEWPRRSLLAAELALASRSRVPWRLRSPMRFHSEP